MGQSMFSDTADPHNVFCMSPSKQKAVKLRRVNQVQHKLLMRLNSAQLSTEQNSFTRCQRWSVKHGGGKINELLQAMEGNMSMVENNVTHSCVHSNSLLFYLRRSWPRSCEKTLLPKILNGKSLQSRSPFNNSGRYSQKRNNFNPPLF